MTRTGYRLLVGGLLLLCISGVLLTLWAGWRSQRVPETVDCNAWLRDPYPGRFQLTECFIVPERDSNNGRTCLVRVGDVGELWTTSEPSMMRVTEQSAESERALARYLRTHHTTDILVDANWGSYGDTMVLDDPSDPELSVWVGVFPFFLFGLPLVLLVRKQRKWRAARLAWERAQGILTEGDKPTAF